jgi:polyhydroxybutyrate depolymerase
MRKVTWLVIAAVLVLGAATCGAVRLIDGSGQQAKASVRVPTTTRTYYMTAGGRKRGYAVIAPKDGLPGNAPVIVVLSGLGASVAKEAKRDELTPYVAADAAELVYPIAVDESWDAIGCCGYAGDHKIDDLDFLKALVAKVNPGGQHSLDLLGFSNGARLAYRVACTDPGLFDQYAMVKGLPLSGCVVSKPVTLLQAAATDDPEIPYKPGDKGIEKLPVTTEMYYLGKTDHCPATSVRTHAKDMTLTSFSGCADGTRLALAAWPTGKHVFPDPPTTKQSGTAEIWSFFTQTPLAPLP